MKGKKLVISLGFALMFLFMLTCSAVFADMTFSDVVPDDATRLTLNNPKVVLISEEGQTATYKFTPSQDGIFMFRAYDTYGQNVDSIGRVMMYDQETDKFTEVAIDDDGGDDAMFLVTFNAKANKDYYLQFALYNKNSNYIASDINVEVSTVQSISFIPQKPYQFIVNDESYGYNETTSDGKQFFYYEEPSVSKGDQLILTRTDGSKERYVYDDYEEKFIYGTNVINSSAVQFGSDQYSTPWVKTGNYNFTFSYLGASCDVPVSIVESNIESISFEPSTPFSYEENEMDCGEYELDDKGEEYYDYYLPGYHEGDKLTITTKANVKDIYTYQYDEDLDEYFFISGTKKISTGDIRKSADQSMNHWTPDKNNNMTITYQGKTCTVPVTIIASDVKSITYKQAQIPELVENMEGYWQLDSADNKYFHYYEPYSFYEGDVITITTSGGTKTYVYGYNEDEEENCFESSDGELISEDKFYTSSNQYSTHWKVGSENKYLVVYKGKSAEAKVTIKANPITGISYQKAKKVEYLEEDEEHGEFDIEDNRKFFRYYLPNPEEGDKLIVTKGSESVTYECKKYSDEYDDTDYRFENVKDNNDYIYTGNIYFDSDQYETPWTVGEHNVTVEYGGKECTFAVTIKANPDKDRQQAIKNGKAMLNAVKDVAKGSYTDTSFKQFTDAKAALQALVDSETSTVQQINDAMKTLADATNGLKCAADEEAEKADAAEKTSKDKAAEDAKSVISEADKLNAADYTADSFKAVTEAKSSLEALLKNPDAKAAEIAAAKETLSAAINALVKNPTPTPTDETTEITVGTTVTVGGSAYVVTGTTTAALKKAKNAKAFSVPASVKLSDGKSYNVTQVNAKAFTGKKIKTVTIGKNVKKLAKNAFKSSKASKMIVKTKSLKKASVKGSLKGSKIKTVQVKVGNKKVNKTFVKKYKKIFTKKIAGKKVKVK